MSLLLNGVFLFFSSCVNAQSIPPNPTLPSLAGFTENKGQIADPHVLFNVQVKDIGLFITDSGMTYVFIKEKTGGPSQERKSLTEALWCKVQMELVSAQIKKENVITENAVEGYSNYYYEHCPDGILNVRTYLAVTIKNVYPGIDWVLRENGHGNIEYDLIVHPGADPSVILIRYKGADELNVIENRLRVKAPYGEFYEGNLNCFEKDKEQKRNPVASNYFIQNKEVRFQMGNYDHAQDLVIDPPLLWTANQSGAGTDIGNGVAAAKDGTGNVYITGETNSANYPTMIPYQAANAGSIDVVIAKLNGSTGARIWSTYYGGTVDESGKGISTDNSGNCYITGYTTSSGFPRSALPAFVAGQDAFVLKFAVGGTRTYGLLFGGSGNDYGSSIVVDGAGVTYAAGSTSSTNFPTAGPALQAAKSVGYDAYIMKLTAAGATTWATYYGGNDDDKANAVAINSAGTVVYFTGYTLATNFPGTAGSFQPASGSISVEDAFIVGLNTTTQAIQFASYCGGNDMDFGMGIAVRSTGEIFITGYTISSNFPTVNPGGGAYYDATQGSAGTHDAFVVECNVTGTTRLWSTYFGGSGVDIGYGISLGSANGIYITGSTGSTDFPTMVPSDGVFYQGAEGDAGALTDAFVAWFGANRALQWSTYYGFANGDEGRAISVDASAGAGNIFVVGTTNTDFLALKFGPGSMLPVELLSFTGTAVQDGNLLQWVTATETNNDFFTVERSADGKNFIPVMRIEGSGNSNEILHYQAMDDGPPAGINYYRLKQTDFDGRYQYSDLIAIENSFSGTLVLHLFPNPVSDKLSVEIPPGLENMDLEVMDARGRILLRMKPGNVNGISIVDVSSFSPGIYFINLNTSNKKLHQKFIKL